MWAEEKLNDFNDPASYGGLPETAQSVLNKHLVSILFVQPAVEIAF